MKLMVSFFAISALGMGAAFAAPLTSADEQRVRQVVPDANLTMLSDEQSSLLAAYVNQDDFGRDPSDANYIRAVLNGQVTMDAMTPVGLSATDAERITMLVPDADLSKLTEEQATMLSNFVNGAQYQQSPGSEEYVAAVLSGELSSMPLGPDMLSTSDEARVRMLLPDAQLTGLTEQQVSEISTFVNSGDYGRSPNDAEFLRSVLNS